MTDENDNSRQTSAPAGRAPLTLKPRAGGAVSAGVVKQSFSHGRSKTVVVETKRRRVDGIGGAAPLADRRPTFDVKAPAPRPAAPSALESAPTSAQTGGLSEDERRARQRAIELAREQHQEREAQLRREAAARAPAAAPAASVESEPAVAAAPEPRAEAVNDNKIKPVIFRRLSDLPDLGRK